MQGHKLNIPSYSAELAGVCVRPTGGLVASGVAVPSCKTETHNVALGAQRTVADSRYKQQYLNGWHDARGWASSCGSGPVILLTITREASICKCRSLVILLSVDPHTELVCKQKPDEDVGRECGKPHDLHFSSFFCSRTIAAAAAFSSATLGAPSVSAVSISTGAGTFQ